MVIYNRFSRTALRLSGLALVAVLSLGRPARSQVSLSPLVIELDAKRGQAQSVIDLRNSGNEPFRARVYAEPFTYSRDKGFQSLKSSPTDLTPYLQFSPREVIVQPNTRRRIRLITRFPPSLPEGEYRAVIFTENLTETLNSEGIKVSIRARVGVTVYVRQGKLSPNLAVASASWNPEQRQVQLLVKNTGAASVRPKVNWTLKRGDAEVATGTVRETGLVAESERHFLLQYPAKEEPVLSPGTYQLKGELLWGNDFEDPETLPFSLDFTMPSQASTSGQAGR